MNLQQTVVLFFVLIGLVHSHGYAESNRYEYTEDKWRNREEKEILKLKENIGKRFWVIKNDSISFYDSPSMVAKCFYVTSTQSFLVQDFVSNSGFALTSYYKVVFDSGKIAYLQAIDLDESFRNKDYITEEAPKVAEERRRRGVEKLLGEIGISKGRIVWLKYPRSGLPGLTKIKVKSFELKDDRYSPSIKLYIEAENREVDIYFSYYSHLQSTISEIKDAFYYEDPSPVISKWGSRALKAIKEGKIFIGMDKGQVRASWGLPRKINSSGGSWGIHEQWIYGDFGPYLYFENDRLTSWQD